MLRINKSGDAASLLYLCHRMQCNRRLTTGFRSVDLYDTSLRQTTDSKRQIKTQ